MRLDHGEPMTMLSALHLWRAVLGELIIIKARAVFCPMIPKQGPDPSLCIEISLIERDFSKTMSIVGTGFRSFRILRRKLSTIQGLLPFAAMRRTFHHHSFHCSCLKNGNAHEYYNLFYGKIYRGKILWKMCSS